MTIIFRPKKQLLADAMAESKEFNTVEDMLNYVCEYYEDAFRVEDIFISYGCYDDRLDWNTFDVTVGRYWGVNCLERYHYPQSIGYCTFKY